MIRRIHTSTSNRCRMAAVLGVSLLVGLAILMTAASRASAEEPGAGDDLSVEQARLADRYERLEEVIGRLAELSAGTDPRRARLLRDAIAKSREQDINVRFEAIVDLLESERLSNASRNQTELQKTLDDLLTLLLKADRDREIDSERQRVRKYLREVGRLIRLQKGLRARTEGGDDLDRLTEEQGNVADEAGKLGVEIDETEGREAETVSDSQSEDGEVSDGESGESKSGSSESGESKPGEDSSGDAPSESTDEPSDSSEGQSSKGEPSAGEPSEGQPSEGQPSDGPPSEGESSEGQPSEGQPSPGQPGQPGQPGGAGSSEPQPSQPPSERAADRLRAAQERMQQAQEQLEQAERENAMDRQREALKELEQAKAELERILRQLREEEMERTLTQLAARFRKMLEAELKVYDGTLKIDAVAVEARDHKEEIEAARLRREQSLIVHEADKAILLLHEEGSSVAFPEAIEQMREDMEEVIQRLTELKVGKITQGLEEDIIEALEETIAALEKALQDLEENRTPPGNAPPPGEMAEPPLVDKLAELKMIRSLQMRINRRTQRYGEMIADEQAESPELLSALGRLANRQERVYRATYDLSEGLND